MNHTYRIRFGEEPYVPTRIVVRMLMTGVQHILFTEREGETYGDLKNALLPHIRTGSDKTLLRCQLSFIWKNADDTFTIDVDNDEIIPDGKDIEVNLAINLEPTWKPEQQRIVTKLRGENVWSHIELNDMNTPDKMEACLWSIQNNPITFLSLNRIRLDPIMRIMNIIHENPSIQRLRLDNNGLDENEMAEVFEMIGRNNTLNSIFIRNIDIILGPRVNTYRINDLANCLAVNTSLTHVLLENCRVIVDENTTLANVLENNQTLVFLALAGNISIDVHENRFLDSLRQIANVNQTDDRFNVRWIGRRNL